MSAKQILYAADARERLGQGVGALGAAVQVTLGPRGRNVALQRSFGAPLVTKDGATVAKDFELSDRFANLGAQMVKEVASKTAEVSGDGTTTATVLACEIYREGVKLVAAGADPMALQRGMVAGLEVVVASLEAQSQPVRAHATILQVATVSANGDEMIGRLIADAVEKVGRDGVVTVEGHDSVETTLEFALGMQIDRGYASPYFVTDPVRMEAVLEDTYVLVLTRKIANVQELVPLLEQVAKAHRPLAIFAEDIESAALATLVVNKLGGTLEICVIKGPGFGVHRKDVLGDLAVLCGARAIGTELGIDLSKLTIEDLGEAKRITVDRDTTTIVDGAGVEDDVTAHVGRLRREIEERSSEQDCTRLRGRAAKLVGGVAVVKVGAATESEMKERKSRVEDAVHATRAAVEEGIVPGGGVAMIRAISALESLDCRLDERLGVTILSRALEQPLRQIAKNAGQDGAVVVGRVALGAGSLGYNALTDSYEDLLLAGIIDPTMVARVAVQNAVSVASLMLTTEVLIAEPSEADAAVPE